MSRFWKKKKFTVNEKEMEHKVRYLGNVATSLTKGEGCVDKPTGVLWNNYLRTANGGIDMKMCVCSTGLRVETKTQGITEYRAHRITYCIAHPAFPRVFVWVYKHEGKRMKVELRCHAVLCKTEAKAKAIAVALHEKLSTALREFMREKTRRQNSRLAMQRSNSLPTNSLMPMPATGSGTLSGVPLRKKFLSTAQNFKPSIERSASAPKLGAITEDFEGEILEEVAEEEDEDFDDELIIGGAIATASGVEITARTQGGDDDLSDHLIDLTIGNNIDELRRDHSVMNELERPDSDADSSESGFSEQEARDALTSGADSASNGHPISMDTKHGDDDNVSADACSSGTIEETSDEPCKKLANGAIKSGAADGTPDVTQT